MCASRRSRRDESCSNMDPLMFAPVTTRDCGILTSSVSLSDADALRRVESVALFGNVSNKATQENAMHLPSEHALINDLKIAGMLKLCASVFVLLVEIVAGTISSDVEARPSRHLHQTGGAISQSEVCDGSTCTTFGDDGSVSVSAYFSLLPTCGLASLRLAK